MICKFHVGQQVVCVVNKWDPADGWRPESFPAKGHVYTIKNIHPGPQIQPTPDSHIGVWIECPSGVWLELVGWAGHYCSFEFKPAKPTNIKEIERLLDVSPEDVRDIEVFDHVLAQMEDDGVLKRSVVV